MSNPHPDVVATDEWLEANHSIKLFVARLELAAGEVKKVEHALLQANAALREAEEKLEDHATEVAYPVNMDAAYKNTAQRDAAVAKLLREDDRYRALRCAVESAKKQQEAARSELRYRENHEKNLRIKAEVVAARLRAIAR